MTKLKQDTLLWYKCVLHMYNGQIKPGHFAMVQMCYICTLAKLKQDTLLCYKCVLHMYNDQIKTGHFAMLQMCVTYVQWPN